MSTRITVRLDDALYARLILFAQGRSQGQVPEVSTIVREALEYYLLPRRRPANQVSDSQSDVVRRIPRHDYT